MAGSSELRPRRQLSAEAAVEFDAEEAGFLERSSNSLIFFSVQPRRFSEQS